MKKILLVDDAIEIQAWIADFLRNHYIHVQASANGAQAIKELSATKYDIVLTDLSMPQEDGISVIYKIKNNLVPLNRHTPVIVITGKAQSADGNIIIEGLETLGIKILHKPFTPEDLLEAVCTALGIDVKDIDSLMAIN